MSVGVARTGSRAAVCAVASLPAGVGSSVVAETEALVLSVAAAFATTCTVATASLPLAIVPSGHVTAPAACMHDPGLAELNVTSAGSVWVSTTPVAAAGPALCTVSV